MDKTTDSTKLTKLHELTSLLPREIRGQSHALPRIISAVQRGELGLTKPARPRGSFLLLGPTGVGKTETVVVTTNQVFGSGKLFRFDMSDLQPAAFGATSGQGMWKLFQDFVSNPNDASGIAAKLEAAATKAYK